jgi:hypothetical protein
MALMVASMILPPDSFTSTWSPTLYLGMVAAFYYTPSFSDRNQKLTHYDVGHRINIL